MAIWSIHSDSSSDNIDNWVVENRVGCDWIDPSLKGGVYGVQIRDFWTDEVLTMRNNALIANGRVAIDTVIAAVDEYIERTGDSDHCFIERIVNNAKGCIGIHLGS